EELADRTERARIGGRVGTGAPADRRLVDLDHLVEHLPAGERIVRGRLRRPAPEVLRQGGIDRVDDQAGLPRPRDSGDAGHRPEGDVDADAAEVVRARAAYPDGPAG